MKVIGICRDCGIAFPCGPRARFCPACRKKHVGESARRRRLCDIGAGARWGQKQKEGS